MSARKSSKLGDGTTASDSYDESSRCSSNCPLRELFRPSGIGKDSTLLTTLSTDIVVVESSDNSSNDLSSRSNPVKEDIRKSIIQLTKSRGPEKSICPSEVCRKIFPPTCWTTHMLLVRQVGFQLADEEIIVVTQRNRVIPPAEFDKLVGPIRFKILKIES